MANLPLHFAQAVIPTALHRVLGIKTSTLHGAARWMTKAEQARFLNPAHEGLVLSGAGRLSLSESCKNLVLMAPTGSGKTTRYVIPNLLALQGSAMVTDPSGELYRLTSGHLAARGWRIRVLQPADVDRSLRFNPLAHIQSLQGLRRLATTLARHRGGAEPFWTDGAANLLFLVLLALADPRHAAYRNLANARWLLNHFGKRGQGLQDLMAATLNPVDYAEFLAFTAQDDKVIAGMVSSARTALDLWSDPAIARLTATDTMTLADLRRVPTVIYLIVPEDQLGYFGLLLNLFYAAGFERCLTDWDEGVPTANAGKLPVYFLLDEFGNLGKIDQFAAIITTLRKRRCSVSLILQEFAQLEALYGRLDARTIFAGGCAHKLFFSGLDAEACRYVEAALGCRTAYDTYFEGIDEDARTVAQPLLRAAEVRMLPAREGILISGREPPLKLTLPPYFTVPAWAAAAAGPPWPFPGPSGGADAVTYYPLPQAEPPARSGLAD